MGLVAKEIYERPRIYATARYETDSGWALNWFEAAGSVS